MIRDVLGAGADLVGRLRDLNERIRRVADPLSGCDSVFVGRMASGEIYNQAPTECCLSGTRRWVTPGQGEAVVKELRGILDETAAAWRTEITADFEIQGEAFRIDEGDPIVTAFQAAHAAVTGRRLPPGGKPFVDDGNTFAQYGIPSLTHGPAGKGAHTENERVPVDELVRAAQVYALTAVAYCGDEGSFHLRSAALGAEGGR